MKKSQLRQIIQEEIQNILNEAENPKLIDIWFTDSGRYYKTLVDNKNIRREETEKLIKDLTGIELALGRMNNRELENAANILKEKNIKLVWDDAFDPS
jgi:hypothetical protein